MWGSWMNFSDKGWVSHPYISFDGIAAYSFIFSWAKRTLLSRVFISTMDIEIIAMKLVRA
jgi:hypothetical protein